MKRIVFTHLTIIWLLTLLVTACTPPAEPVSVTRPATLTNTAVPPTNTPPATATMNPTPTIASTDTPDPAAAQPSFLETLQMELNNRQFRSVESKLDSPFLAGIYPAATGFSNARDVLFMIQTRLLPQLKAPAITFYQLDAAAIPPHLTPAALFPETAAQISVVGSSGWGLAASGEALLYLRADADSYLWAGFVLGYGDFEIALDLETISAPPGLIYQVGDDYWQIDADGEPRLLIADNGRLSLNPTATLALSAETADEFVTLFDLVNGSSAVIEVDGRLMISSNRVVWLDEETAVLLLTEERSLSQGTNGFPALLNTTSGTLTKLDLELSNYAQPAVTTEGTLVFGVNEAGELQLWLDGQLTTAPIAALETWPNHFGYPHLSPDGRQVIGTSTSETEPGRIVYLLASTDQPDSTILQAIHAIPTDAAIPWHIDWSPGGQFVALAPPSWDIVETGTWLVSTDDSTKIFLGPGSDSAVWGSGFSSPVWLDANRVVFSAVWHRQSGLQLYDLATNKRFWLDTPQFAITLRDRFQLSAEKIIAPVQFIAATE